MVGYYKDDSIAVNHKLIAGCFAGCLTRFLTQPMDIVKIRLQLQKKSGDKMHTMQSLRNRIYTEEGVLAFWHGHSLGQLHSIIAVGTQFYIYEVLSKYVITNYDTHRHKNIFNCMCGAVAGSVSCAMISPLEVIRVRQMLVKEQYKGLVSGARAVYKSGGIFAFYEGLSASLIQIAPASGASFAVFNFVQKSILLKMTESDQNNDTWKGLEVKPLLYASAVAGATAGFVSKTIVYPFDLAKRRLQISSHISDTQTFKTPGTSTDLAACNQLFGCLVHAYQTEGVRGLYRGWTITILKAQVTSILAYTTYELSCLALRKFETRE